MNDVLLEKTKQLLLKRFKEFKAVPQVAIITGSGIKLFRDKEPLLEVKYKNLPFSPIKKNVKGHEGVLKLYKIKDTFVIVFCGRHHLYEGLGILDVIATIRLIHKLKIKTLILTNAAGGINKNFKPGDLMLITGFIDLMQSTERGVLSGISQPSKKIQTKLSSLIQKHYKKDIRTGIYAGVLGPSYETYSEIKLLQHLGAGAVGMSTVPEIICAKSLGLDFAGISLITNVWDSKHKPSHKEVLEQAKKANEKLDNLISGLVKKVFGL